MSHAIQCSRDLILFLSQRIAIKSSLERPTFIHDAQRTLQLARQTGFAELPVCGEVAARVRHGCGICRGTIAIPSTAR